MSIVKVILRKMLSSVELWRCRAWHTQLSCGQDKDIYNFRSLKGAMHMPKSYSRVSMEELCKAQRHIYRLDAGLHQPVLMRPGQKDESAAEQQKSDSAKNKL